MTGNGGPPDDTPVKPLSEPGNHADAGTAITTWIDHDDANPDAAGRVMLRVGPSDPELSARPAGLLERMLNQVSPPPTFTALGLNLLEAVAANDNTIWVGSVDGEDGAFGTHAAAVALAGRGTVIAWIGEDRIIHANFVPSENQDATASATDDTRKLNEVLSNLGSAGLPSASDSGRLAVVATARNTFTAIWVADFGATAALMGKAFTFVDPNAAGEAAGADAQARGGASLVVAHALPPVRIAGHVERFDAATSADGELRLDVEVAGPAGELETITLLVLQDGDDAPVIKAVDGTGLSDAEPLVQQAIAARADQALVEGEQQLPAELPAAGDDDVQGNDDPEAAPAAILPVGGSSSLASELAIDPLLDGLAALPEFDSASAIAAASRPTIALANNTSASLDYTPGQTPGTVLLTVTIVSTTESSDPQTTTFVVADNAVVADAERPDLVVAPVLAASGDVLAVSWVGAQENTPDGSSVRTLNVTVVSLHSDQPEGGAPAAETATLLTTNESISDLDLVGRSTPDYVPQWTAAWIQNADVEGYGALNLKQLRLGFDRDKSSNSVDDAEPLPALWDAQPGQETALPGVPDAHTSSGAAVDAFPPAPPFGSERATFNPAGPIDEQSKGRTFIDEYARAPDIEIVSSDALAIAWVGREQSRDQGATIHGLLVTNDLETVYRFDIDAAMTGDIDVREGPEVATTGQNGFIIGWLRERDDHSYEAVAVTVHFAQETGWSMSQQVIQLARFEDEPKDLDFDMIQRDGEMQALLRWTDHGDRQQLAVDLDTSPASLLPAASTDDALLSGPASPGAGANLTLVETTSVGVVLAIGSDGESDSGKGSSSDQASLATLVAGLADENSDIILFTGADANAVAMLSAFTTGPTAQELQNTITAFSEPPVGTHLAGEHRAESTGDEVWPQAQSIDEIIEALGDQVLFSGAFSSIDPIDIKPENDNGQDHEAFDEVGSVFDALQFANVLNASVNTDVITFDATGYATLKDLDPL